MQQQIAEQKAEVIKAFIETWQTSRSVCEVAEKLNLSEVQAACRANYYRTKGIGLIKLPRALERRTTNWKALRELADSLLKGTEPDPSLLHDQRGEVAFVQLWQTAESVEEVAQRLATTRMLACSRASRYRAKGVQLKHMKAG